MLERSTALLVLGLLHVDGQDFDSPLEEDPSMGPTTGPTTTGPTMGPTTGPSSAPCRFDICDDSYAHGSCCAPPGAARSCTASGYVPIPGGWGQSGRDQCVWNHGASALYQCCPGDFDPSDCRGDICSDAGEDCCARGNETRACALPEYISVEGEQSLSCEAGSEVPAVFQCCRARSPIAGVTAALYPTSLLSSSSFRRPTVVNPSMSTVGDQITDGRVVVNNVAGLPNVAFTVSGAPTFESNPAGSPAGTVAFNMNIIADNTTLVTSVFKSAYQLALADALLIHPFQIAGITFTMASGQVLEREGTALALVSVTAYQLVCPSQCAFNVPLGYNTAPPTRSPTFTAPTSSPTTPRPTVSPSIPPTSSPKKLISSAPSKSPTGGPSKRYSPTESPDFKEDAMDVWRLLLCIGVPIVVCFAFAVIASRRLKGSKHALLPVRVNPNETRDQQEMRQTYYPQEGNVLDVKTAGVLMYDQDGWEEHKDGPTKMAQWQCQLQTQETHVERKTKFWEKEKEEVLAKLAEKGRKQAERERKHDSENWWEASAYDEIKKAEEEKEREAASPLSGSIGSERKQQPAAEAPYFPYPHDDATSPLDPLNNSGGMQEAFYDTHLPTSPEHA